MTKSITLTIHDDPQEPQDTARVVVRVHPATSRETFNDIELTGTRDGLIWLAKRLLEVAHSSPEFHAHLDNEACGPIYHSPDNWWLTISNTQ